MKVDCEKKIKKKHAKNSAVVAFCSSPIDHQQWTGKWVFCERGHRSRLWCWEKSSAKHFEFDAGKRVRLIAMNGSDICCSTRSCFVVYPACFCLCLCHWQFWMCPAVFMSKHVVDVSWTM